MISKETQRVQNPLLSVESADVPKVILNAQAEAGLARLASVLQQQKQISLVLVIDDNDHDAFFLEKALKQVEPGIEVSRVGNGADAIAYLEGAGDYLDRCKFPLPLLILLDLNLPGVSGLSVLQHLRSRPELMDISVVTLTGSSDPGMGEIIHRLGVSAFIEKPTSTDGFVGIVQGLKTSGLL